MTLRHIRPRSIEWYDALMEEDGDAVDRLSPEETLRLRTLLLAEQAGERRAQAVSQRMVAMRYAPQRAY